MKCYYILVVMSLPLTGVTFHLRMVQLKGNLMPAHGSLGEKVWVNLQMGAGVGVGARNVLHQPGGHPFRSSFLNTLILTVVQATFAALFICESLCKSSRVVIN